ncbi:acyltransferase domain-containing protein [Erysipelothrix rhusiopathiae]|uniref:acyltransferase domain-containing protein n=1 Tax=Erysipelothrix rhusiopathiae TaxID=1648 RepID=UPI0023AF86B1|nr:acyltransferase domain-containing protein [Erysipelothrix rhusiopathiae]MDE8119294.1 acyltransferase domain-containing protein [Erysipelothrix rhusiopathiae]MDE8132842.1 acyltransferase domain-containing protein [Erysipelothrix rhusiopathiae]MDE8146857.1 acyltransferase domain-containing protein [Erysipelothrix rhusiopathiae]MDE8194296.1 acyltransferase domain-containing protein [Erysipelothrix rhusiopathiae]
MLKKLLKTAQFNDDAISILISQYDNYQYVLETCEKPYTGEKNALPILKLNPQERLMRTLYMLPELKEQYIQRGIDDAIFNASIQDLNYRIERYHKSNDHYGLSDSDVIWLRFMFRFEMFELGSLRYQIFPFSYAEIERSGHDTMHLPQQQKHRFPENTMMLNIHIKRDANLSPQAIDASLKQAHDFFTKTFPEHHFKAFITRTWLIHRGIMALIGDPNSHIVQFGNRFEVIASSHNRYQALERIYGTTDMYEISRMNKTTQLQRDAYKHPEMLGVACGIIEFESFE